MYESPQDPFANPEQIVQQVQFFLAESSVQLLRYGCSAYAYDRLSGRDEGVIHDIEAEIQKMADENTLAVAGISKALKANGHEFALRNNQLTHQYSVTGVGFAFDPKKKNSYSGYVCDVNHSTGTLRVPLRPTHLTYQPYDSRPVLSLPKFAPERTVLKDGLDFEGLVAQGKWINTWSGRLKDFSDIEAFSFGVVATMQHA